MRQAVLFIHGVGKQEDGYSRGLEKHIRSTSDKLLDDAESAIIYKEVL